MTLMNAAFGTGGDAFRLANVIGNSEAYSPVLDFTKMIPPYGIKLDAGTVQKFQFAVRDDLTLLDGFDAIAYGFDRLL